MQSSNLHVHPHVAQQTIPLLARPRSRRILIAHSGIIQRDTHGAAMMPIILPDNALTPQLPQPCIMVTTRSDEIGAVSAERTVPDPALVAMQGGFEREGGGVALGGGGQLVARLQVVRRGRVEGPDARGVVGAAGGEVADVRGQQDARDVG